MWQPASFMVATDNGVTHVDGVIAKGIGLHLMRKTTLTRPRALTAVVHLGSGHAICLIEADVITAGRIAAEIVNAGDWEFDGLKGWENMDPMLSLKVQAICNRNIVHIRRASPGADDFQARKIARERA